MSEFDETTIKAIEDLTQRALPLTIATPTYDGVTFPIGAIYRGPENGYELIDVTELVDAERAAPKRKKGTATALSLKSFTDLIDRHSDEGSAIFADIVSAEPKVQVVFDYHYPSEHPEEDTVKPGAARFGDHRALYLWPMSDEWKAWGARNGTPFSQNDFAEWIEARIPDLATPNADERDKFEAELQTKFGTPAEIINVSRGLSITVTQKVTNAVVLASGASQVTFEETHQGVGAAPVTVPGLFLLSIPLFVGGEIVRIPARLRYRKVDAGLKWSYHLYRPEFYIRAALRDDLYTIQTVTGLPLYEGYPEEA